MEGRVRRKLALLFALALLAPASAEATFPGTNGKIAFLCYRDDALLHVCSIPPEGGQWQYQAGLAANVTSAPRWSPNGRNLLYQYETPDFGIIRAPGLRSIRGSESHSQPAWSPRGDRIAAVRYARRGPRGIFVFSTTGRNRRLLVRDAADPDWSPNGRFVAYAKGRDIHVYDLTRRRSRRVTRTPVGSASRFPSWSPDGRRIAFGRASGSGATFTSNIFTIAANGRDPRQVTTNPTRGRTAGDTDPSWSPDGRFIAYVHGLGNGGGYALATIAVDGTGQRILLAPPTFVSAFAPDWGRRRGLAAF